MVFGWVGNECELLRWMYKLVDFMYGIFAFSFSEWLLCRVTLPKLHQQLVYLLAEESFPWWTSISSSFFCLFSKKIPTDPWKIPRTLKPTSLWRESWNPSFLDFWNIWRMFQGSFSPAPDAEKCGPRSAKSSFLVTRIGESSPKRLPVQKKDPWRWLNYDPSFTQIIRFIRDVWGPRNTNEFSLLPVSFKIRQTLVGIRIFWWSRNRFLWWPWHDFWGV